MHLLHNVTPSNELALDVDLRQSGPVAKLLDTLSYTIILQAVNILVLLDSVELHHLHYVVAKPTLWHLLVALHENYDVVLVNHGLEFLGLSLL